jgi:hypothetical protein
VSISCLKNDGEEKLTSVQTPGLSDVLKVLEVLAAARSPLNLTVRTDEG